MRKLKIATTTPRDNKNVSKLILLNKTIRLHLDEFDHTNNTIYLVWMQAIAALHSKHLGLTFQDFVELGYGCVARQYQIVRESDHATVMQGHTQWVCIDMKSGPP